MTPLQARHQLFDVMRLGPVWTSRLHTATSVVADSTLNQYAITTEGVAESALVVINMLPNVQSSQPEGDADRLVELHHLLTQLLCAIGHSLNHNTFLMQIHSSMSSQTVEPGQPVMNDVELKHAVRQHLQQMQPKVLLLLGQQVVSWVCNNPESILPSQGRVMVDFQPGVNPVAVIQTAALTEIVLAPQIKRQVWQDLLWVKQQLA